jgi:hypothetical protein
MRTVWIEVLKDVEVYLAAVGVETVDELAATVNQSLEVVPLILPA